MMIGLGLWQLQRQDEKQRLLSGYEQQLKMLPLPVSSLEQLPLLSEEQINFFKIEIAGNYDFAHQFLLDNQVRNSRVGYEILTPLELENQPGEYVIVARGWIPRSETIDIPTPESADYPGSSVLTGMYRPFPKAALRLGAVTTSRAWPKVVQYPEAREIEALLDLDLAPGLLVETDEVKYYSGQRPGGGFGPERHLGYAIQWFAMATALIVIYFIWVWRLFRGAKV